ncbi:MAG: hypothetical protein KF893_08915 [Caldilineaceae bacterium]|nr:hypothetical protein [Caldilineaceae bacterium]
MSRLFSHIHTFVKREGAEQFLLYSLLSFAASVGLTRLFLELTGYPQLGNSELHIAHVLWGGLLLFVASLLPLVLTNRWVYPVGGILSGAGVGLFIDEVGKFITQTNDYFYPPAAPIIYAFFLLVVLFYLRVRRPAAEEPRAELYRTFDALQDVLDHDLDHHERAELVTRLQRIRQTADHPNYVALADALLDFVTADSLELAPVNPSIEERLQAFGNRLLDRYLPRPLLRSILALALLIMGGGMFADLALLLTSNEAFNTNLLSLLGRGDEVSANLIFLSLARLVLETAIGTLLMVGALLLLARRERLGVFLGYFGLLLSLTILNLLVFYFDQFSAILVALVQFNLLMGLIIYRQRYLAPPVDEVAQALNDETEGMKS